MNILIDLFLSFAKIGLFTFGGGYAMISVIQNKCVESKKWISQDELMNITIIAESTPGPIAINAATYVGYQQAGFLGALFATVGIILPSFLVIYIISMFLDNFLELTIIANAFKGIKVAVGILILDAGITMVKKIKKKPFPYTIMFIAFTAMMFINIFALKISSMSLMMIAAVISLSVFIVKGGGSK